MKNTSKIISIFLAAVLCFSGCAAPDYSASKQLKVSVQNDMPTSDITMMSDKYAVVKYDSELNDSKYSDTYSTLLINDTTNTPEVVKDVHKLIYPASMTKLMTGLLVIESIEAGTLSLDDEVTLDRTVTFDDWGAVASPLTVGCKTTVKDLLYGLLISSYNDCAVILSELVSGSESAFVEAMNTRAKELGATNTHYKNPHGLHDDGHYTTAYDLYLIFKEFTSHDLAYVIDSTSSYTFQYKDPSGNSCSEELEPTNGFMTGEYQLPSGFSIGSWKSGTTMQAGHCLIVEFVNNSTGDKFFAVCSGNVDRDTLYGHITDLIKTSK